MEPDNRIVTRRRILEGAACLAAASFLPGCGGNNGSSTSTTPTPPTPTLANPQPVPSGPIVQGTVTVNGTSAGSIPAAFMGLSYEKYVLTDPYFHTANTDLIALFKLLGQGVLRLGGGTVDQALWTQDGNGTTYLQVAPSDVDALAGFLKAAGWQCLYGINLATSTPALAAAEVAYAVSSLGSSLIGIEIGSACDTYGDAGSYFPGNWTFQDFLARWQSFQAAILAATPSAPLVGPSTSASDFSSWGLPFGQAETAKGISLLTQQYFRADGQDPASTAALLISPDTQLTSYLQTINTGSKQLGIPYRMAGCNSFYSGGAPGVSNSYASSLWVLDFLFDSALNGATGINMHGNGANSYAAIADKNGTVTSAQPEYYGLLLFSLAGAGTLLQTTLSATGLNATAYSVKTTAGTNLILVNKDSTQNLEFTVETSQTVTTANLLAMAAPSLASTSGITIQGATVNIDGSFTPAAAYTLAVSGTSFTCYVPALCAVVITVS